MSADLDAELFRIVAYLVACAGCQPELTLELASLMHLQAAERLIRMTEASEAFTADPFLRKVRLECAAHKDEVMHDPAAYRNWISDLERRVVLEARRRNAAQSATPD